MNDLTIVMYHYVRDPARSRYPRIKGRSIAEFREQMDYIANNYVVIGVEEILAAVAGDAKLPPKAIWLTFDDGYLDHYLTVFPLLHARGWHGSFFPSGRTLAEGVLLDVNKIHFVLAAEPNVAAIVAAVKSWLAEHGRAPRIKNFDDHWRELAISTRFDDGETAFVKRLLQHALSEPLRGRLTDHLFRTFVSTDVAGFVAEHYMSADQIRVMHACGMHIGSHGYDHCWLHTLPPASQEREIDLSLRSLAELGVTDERWVMCYPYGSYNDSLVDIIAARGCALALTTRVDVADLSADPLLALPRLDTNDLPPLRN